MPSLLLRRLIGLMHCSPIALSRLVLWSAVTLFILLPVGVSAAPVFTESKISVSSESPKEGDVVRFFVALKNTGDAPAEFAQLKIEWPLMGHMIGVVGLDEVTTDHDERTLRTALSLPTGAERRIEIDVLAPRDSGGDALTLSVHLAHYASGAELWDHKTLTIDTRLATNGILVGGLRVAPAGIAVLLWLVVAAVFGLVVMVLTAGKPKTNRLFGPSAAVVAIMIAIGFWMVFGVMAWRDYQVLSSWKESTATILGRRMNVQSTTSSSRSSSGSTRTSSDTYTPEFALRYLVDGKPMVSTGYDTGSSIRMGGRVRREAEMREWVPGATIPCWYDPADPGDVVVKRGFGGAYLFALFPIPVFWIGVVLLRGAFTRRNE